MPPNLLSIPWLRPTRTLVAALILVSIFLGLIYTGFVLHDTTYEPQVIHQAVEAVQNVASEIQHEIVPEDAIEHDLKDERPPDYGTDDFCTAFPDPGNIAVIVKTGATELHAKVPTTLATSLRCVREPLIFSDLEQTLGEHQVHDALANFTAMEGNKDFEFYRKQQEYVAEGRGADLPELSSIPIPSTDWRTAGKSAAWGLDKYKFLCEYLCPIVDVYDHANVMH